MLKRYMWLVHLGILTVFIWVIVGIVMSITGHVLYKMPTPGKTSPVMLETRRQPPKDRSFYDLIKTRDLFKVASRGAVTGVRDQNAVLPIAAMGIILKGTIAGADEIARAIIDDKGKQQLYRIGDEIMGARILAIFRNKVIMEVNGQEQQLIPEEPGAKRGAPMAGLPGASPVGMPGGTTSGDMANVMQNMEQFLGRARVVPYFKGGQPYGFRVSNVEGESPLFGMGVRSGDVIRSVNGIPVRSPEDAFQAYQQLANQSSVQVELERGGSSLSVNVPLK